MPVNSVATDGGAVNVNNALEQCSSVNQDVKIPVVSLEKIAQSHAVNSPSNALLGQCSKSNGLADAWHNGTCEFCKESFKKKTTWQRFCNSECRDRAYFLRTGKQWKGKKIG